METVPRLRAVLSRHILRIVEEDRAGHNHTQHDEQIPNADLPIPYEGLGETGPLMPFKSVLQQTI
jgi:hypothetical protein